MQETQETQVRSLGQEDSLEKGMATHSSILAWDIPWTEEPGGLQSIGSQRVGHNWSDLAWSHFGESIWISLPYLRNTWRAEWSPERHPLVEVGFQNSLCIGSSKPELGISRMHTKIWCSWILSWYPDTTLGAQLSPEYSPSHLFFSPATKRPSSFSKSLLNNLTLPLEIFPIQFFPLL